MKHQHRCSPEKHHGNNTEISNCYGAECVSVCVALMETAMSPRKERSSDNFTNCRSLIFDDDQTLRGTWKK